MPDQGTHTQRDLVIEEVSLLFSPKEPANRRKVLLLKAAASSGTDGGTMPEKTIEIADEFIAGLVQAITKGDDEMDADEKVNAALKGYDAKHRKAVLAMLKAFRAVKEEMSPELLAKLRKSVV